jgi:DNA-binding transcriptional ArsR family regulator
MARDITEINDPRLIKALAHPVRIQVLKAIEDGHSTPSDIARVIDEPLPNVSYHIRTLAKLELIQLSDTTHVRGAVQHHYRAVGRIGISDQAWAEVPADVQTQIVADSLTTITNAAREAVLTGGFAREDAILLRLPMTMDQEGVAELSGLAADFVKAAAKIEKAASKRLKAKNASVPALETTMCVLHFTIPSTDDE